MGKYTHHLRDRFNIIAEAPSAEMDDLLAVYDESYISLTEAFEACRKDIYIDRSNMPSISDEEFLKAFDDEFLDKEPEEMFPQFFATSEQGAPDHIRDYFETMQVLCENDPEAYTFEGDDLNVLRAAFKESLMLAKKHLQDNLAFRNINGDVRELYFETELALDRTLEAL